MTILASLELLAWAMTAYMAVGLCAGGALAVIGLTRDRPALGPDELDCLDESR